MKNNMTNIAEILKKCPSGTILYSPICDECYLYRVEDGEIIVKDNSGISCSFYEDGRQRPSGECLLFPSKENRDWSTFNYTKEFKKGDFLKDSNGNIMKYDNYMDKECIPVCDALNELPDVRTFESCCGHLKRRYAVWLYTDNPYSMAVIARAFDRRYLPTKILWETTIETIDVERTPQFCIGIYSKEAFDDYDTMMHDVNEVVDSIRYWVQPEFYEYFKFNKYNKKDKA